MYFLFQHVIHPSKQHAASAFDVCLFTNGNPVKKSEFPLSSLTKKFTNLYNRKFQFKIVIFG